MTDPPALPPLPDRVEPEALRDLDDEALTAVATAVAAAERETITAMAPYDRQLRELRARAGEVATERRRRERAARRAARESVRERAVSGEMPSVSDALGGEGGALTDDRPLATVRAFLRTGGEVGFGFATRPGSIAFTDGRHTTQARTVGEARRLYADGWEPGAPGVPGVRVHLVGTRVERVAPPDDVVVDVSAGPTGA